MQGLSFYKRKDSLNGVFEQKARSENNPRIEINDPFATTIRFTRPAVPR